MSYKNRYDREPPRRNYDPKKNYDHDILNANYQGPEYLREPRPHMRKHSTETSEKRIEEKRRVIHIFYFLGNLTIRKRAQK